MRVKQKTIRQANERISGTKRLGRSKRQTYESQTPEKLIPELSKLLDEGKINHGSAMLYAKVSIKNQKKIYDTLVNNFLNDADTEAIL